MNGAAAAGAVWMQTAGALVVVAVAAHCAARLVQSSRAAAWPEAAGHAADTLMALGLATMLSPQGSPVPAAAGEVVFGLVAAGSLGGALAAARPGRRAEWLRHAVGAAAMVYMVAMPAGSAWAVLTWMLVVWFALFAGWSAQAAARGLGAVTTSALALPVILAPRVTSLCHVLMAGGMVSLLLAMR